MSLADRTVAVMLPVEDVERAREFYVAKLGLDYVGTDGEGSAMFELAGGTPLMLLPRPGGRRSDSTALSWQVDDVEAEVRSLEERGVVFEDYDSPGLTTVEHIATFEDQKAAWFCDPDGNVLCVHQGSG